MALVVLVWVAVFLTPCDLGYSLLSNKPVYILATILKEIYRVRKVVQGVTLAQESHPDKILLPPLLGLLRGNGSALLKPVALLLCGVTTEGHSELLAPSLTTSLCVAAGGMWHLSSPHQTLYNSLALVFVCNKFEVLQTIRWLLLRKRKECDVQEEDTDDAKKKEE